MSSRNYINGHRRRPCICKDPRCKYISRWYCLADDPNLCCFIRLPPFNKRKTARGRTVRKFRLRLFFKLFGALLSDPKDDSIKDEWVSVIHFDRSLLQDNNKGPVDSIDATAYKKLPVSVKEGYSKSDKIAEGALKGQYFVLPTMSWNDILKRFNEDRADSNNSENGEEEGEVDGRVDPDARRLKIIARAMRNDPEAMATEYLRMENELLEMKLLLKSAKKEHALEVASLHAALDDMKETLKLQIHVTESGLNRITLSSPEWHKAHPDASRFLFGIEDDFEQLTILTTEGFFPGVVPVGGTGDDPVTDYEKILLCLLRIRRRFEYKTLGYIIGRTEGQISRYMDDWLPKLGRIVGRFCCRLEWTNYMTMYRQSKLHNSACLIPAQSEHRVIATSLMMLCQESLETRRV